MLNVDSRGRTNVTQRTPEERQLDQSLAEKGIGTEAVSGQYNTALEAALSRLGFKKTDGEVGE